ncbi:MAG: aminotransferase class IV [Chitinophagaceae bacterium]|nr:aminotransferase class IV [Chitinophagaceae bacterium]MCA6452630.1 aminotransferase class IV [Chitinophagaceae bacterium]MCA6455799.1 aminotransferase class IV [Chitinophagaceae bacterium]MCA6459100.1 aminotransferase class IV [Chitinophagaceae bacterium]MCA6465630.1 aminotransferase class IV [Chitinophagaceae bacterium]
MSNLTCFCDNRFMPLSEASLPVNDLGYQRGYGIFDFLRVTGNTPLYWEDHLDRFFFSAQAMHLPVKYQRDALQQIILQLIKENALPFSGIRIMLSGGSSPDGYQITEPNLVIVQTPLTPPPDQVMLPGYKVVSYPHQRQMPHVKTTDYLMAIWLQPWVKQQNADDVLYHQNGIITEFPRSNFFLVTDDQTIVTPEKNILAGITRKQILQVAEANGLRVIQKDISLEEIGAAREAFISSSTKRVIPIRQLDDIQFAPYTTESVTAKLFGWLRQHEITTAGKAH